MSSLSDKLKSLGVKVGAQDIPKPENGANQPTSVMQVAPGREHETPQGFTYIIDQYLPADYEHGHTRLNSTSSLEIISEWAGDPQISRTSSGAFGFLDIETTGLMGGTGTYAFLVGVGRFEGETFHLAQFFMRDPWEEPAHLLALEEFCAPCQTLVTFNGKTFDIPILNSRFRIQGWNSPFTSLHHLDLLHLSRKLWRDRLPSRTLGNLETFILGARRSEEDVPGWLIPQLYFEYLRSGDAAPLKSVFYHNAMDVVALAALLNHVSHMLEDPFNTTPEQDLERVGIGRLFEDLGRTEEAAKLYRLSLESELPAELLWETVQRLSMIKKRRGDYLAAIELWEKAAQAGQIYACEELAKYYEHHAFDLDRALRWTQTTLDWLSSPDASPLIRQEWLGKFHHRLGRLQRKRAGGNDPSEPEG
jgi:uncharacterized protein YprB with RNaseH-like and TPR domain